MPPSWAVYAGGRQSRYRCLVAGPAAPEPEARIVREFSVPASFSVGEHDNIVSSVFSHEREDPTT